MPRIIEPPPGAVCTQESFGQVLADPGVAPWDRLAALELRETSTGAAPAQATMVKLAWSAEELRVLFVCTDTEVRATYAKDGLPLYEEEVVELFLDPFGDLAAYAEIEVNPLNARLEVLVRRHRQGLRKDFRWRCAGLRSAARRTPDGWAAELALPLASITTFLPAPGAIWRGNFTRIDRPAGQPRELTAWSPTGAATFHAPARFGFIEFR